MNLTAKAIVRQINQELLAWKQLHLKPVTILGTLEPQKAYEQYQALFKDTPNFLTTDIMKDLNPKFSIEHVTMFDDFFKIKHAITSNTSYFSIIPFFQTIITNKPLSSTYNDQEQLDLINSRLPIVYHPHKLGQPNAIYIAAETSNNEMLAFLLRREFTTLIQFDLAKEFSGLLDMIPTNAVPTRQVVLHACATQLNRDLTDGDLRTLLSKITTTQEWCTLYSGLTSVTRQKKLLTFTPATQWTTIITKESDLKAIAQLTPKIPMGTLINTLFSSEQNIVSGTVILQLMKHKSHLERLEYIRTLKQRANNLFSNQAGQASLQDCLTLLGYTFSKNTINLTHLYGSSELDTLKPTIQMLNQAIWESPLDNQLKLQYIYVSQKLITAPPKQQRAAIQLLEQCMRDAEQSRDSAHFFIIRWIRVLFRLFGSYIKPLPATVHARQLIRLASDALKKNQAFQAAILDLDEIILPNADAFDEAKKEALNAFGQKQFDAFWGKMQPTEQIELLSDITRFQKLLQTLPNSIDVKRLMDNLPKATRDGLVDQNRQALLALLQIKTLSMSTVMNCIDPALKMTLLTDPDRLSYMLTNLPKTLLQAYLEQFVFPASLAQDFNLLISALTHADPNQYELLSTFFKWEIPLQNPALAMSTLFQSLPKEKMTPVWNRFLNQRSFTHAEMQTIIEHVSDADKRKQLVTLWMTPLNAIKTWSDDLITALPHMNDDQQAHVLSLINEPTLKRLLYGTDLPKMINVISSNNRPLFLKRGHTLFATYHKTWRNLLCELHALPDIEWKPFVDTMLLIGPELFPSTDPLVQLFTQSIPQNERSRILTLMKSSSEADLQRLLTYLKSNVVKTLIQYGSFDFKHITLEAIQGLKTHQHFRWMTNSADKAVPQLLQYSEHCFYELIRSTKVDIDNKIKVLEAGFTKLLVDITPQQGAMWGYNNYKEPLKIGNDIYQRIQAVEGLIKQQQVFRDLYRIVNMEERVFCSSNELSINTILQKLTQFMDKNKEGLANVEIHKANPPQRDPIIHKAQEPLVKLSKGLTELSNLLKTLPAKTLSENELIPTTLLSSADPTSLLALKLRQESDEVQSIVLDQITLYRITHIVKTNNELVTILQSVTPLNARAFLNRCRTWLCTPNNAQDWLTKFNSLSPSSLVTLFDNAPAETIAPCNATSFTTFIRLCDQLSDDQWGAIAPRLLALGNQHFSQDPWVQLIASDVPQTAHVHVLDLIRKADDDDTVTALFTHLSSASVKGLRQKNRFDDLTLNTTDLPNQMLTAQQRYYDCLKAEMTPQLNKLNHLLSADKTGLFALLTPSKNSGFYSFFGGSQYSFSTETIKTTLDTIHTIIQTIHAHIQQVNLIPGTHLDKDLLGHFNEITASITAKSSSVACSEALAHKIELKGYGKDLVLENGNACLTRLLKDISALTPQSISQTAAQKQVALCPT